MPPTLLLSRRTASAAAFLCEQLEDRKLFAAYVESSLTDYFDLPGVLYDLAAPQGSVGYGASGVGLGDINGDGKGDFAISAVGSVGPDGETTAAGAVFVYSGATGQVLRTLGDTFADFGISLARIGDIDGDGVAELVVGSPRFDGDVNTAIDPTGAAYVYSGASGALLRTFLGTQANSDFGHAVAAAGLADGDTIPDVMVGAPTDGPNNEGRVYILSTAEAFVGLPGAERIYTFTGEASGDRFGFAIAPADLQLPSEGVDVSPDYLIGAPGYSGRGANVGRAYLYRQVDGSRAFAMELTVQPHNPGDEFGYSVVAYKTSETALMAVGIPGQDGRWNVPTPDRGMVELFNRFGQRVGAPLFHEGEAGQRLGTALRDVGDVSRDGFADYANMYAPDSGVAARIFGITSDQFLDESVFEAGDIDGNGENDLISVSPGNGVVRIVSSLGLIPPVYVTGTNNSGSFVWSNGLNSGGVLRVDHSGRDHYAIIDGTYTPYREIPGLIETDAIQAVNDHGLILAGEVIGEHEQSGSWIYRAIVVSNGVRRVLSTMVERVEGGIEPNYDTLGFGDPVNSDDRKQRVGNDGTLVLSDVAPSGGSRVWTLKDGVLTFLWNGVALDIDDSGNILGQDTTADQYVLRAPTGERTVLSGFTPGAMNGAGIIAGSDDEFNVVQWQAGVRTVVGSIFEIANNDGFPVIGVHVIGISRSGIIIFTYSHFTYVGEDPPRPTNYGFYSPGHTLDRLATDGPYAYAGPAVQFAGEAIVGIADYILSQVPGEVRWSLAEGSPVSSTVASGAQWIVGLHTAREIIVQTNALGVWDSFALQLTGSETADITNVLAYTDPNFGLPYVFVLTSQGVFWAQLRENAPTLLAFSNEFAEQEQVITGNASIFYTADQRVVLAGTDADGHLLIYFQIGQFEPNGDALWSWNDLTRDHIQARGDTFVPVAGGLTAFSTPWGTDHIAYLDASGNVQVVWWGAGDPLWRIENLSNTAGAPGMSGPLHSFMTSWQGINIVGADTNGRTATVWWVPGEVWQYSVPIDSTSAPQLDMASVTTFVTPWNAMNIVGRDLATGRTVAYWWMPGFAGWRADELITPSRPEGVVTSGPISGGMHGSNQELFAREASTGHLIEIFWTPGQTNWDVADITELVA